jgi:hypothetical protein
MVRALLMSIGFLFSTVTLALAAPKYAAPPLGIKKCVIEFDAGSPVAEKDGKNWKVHVKGKYNYDDAWTFKKLEVYLTYTKGTESRSGQSWNVTNESALGTPGTFSVTFNGVPPPEPGEVLVATIRITVSKMGEADQVDSRAADVAAPTGDCSPSDDCDLEAQNDMPPVKQPSLAVRGDGRVTAALIRWAAFALRQP